MSQPGDVAGFQILEGIGIFGISIGSDGRSAVVQTEGIAIGQTGTFDVVPSGDLGIQPGDLFYSAGEAGPAQLSLVENDGLVVSGTVTGTVTITPATGSPPETRQGSFFMRFYVESEGGVPGAGGIIAHSCTVQGS